MSYMNEEVLGWWRWGYWRAQQ